MVGSIDTAQCLIYFIFGFIFLFYVRLFYVNRKIIRFSLQNNGLYYPVVPVFGQTYVSLFTGKKRSLLTIAEWLMERTGPPLNFWIGHTYHYISADADEIKAVFTHPKCFNKSTVYKDVRMVFGENSLAFVEQEEWKARRKHFLKSFKPNTLKGFIDTFYKCSCGLLKNIENLNGEVISYDCIYSFVFNTFFVSALGLSQDKFGNEMAEFGGLRDKIEKAITEKMINPFLPYSIWKSYFPTGRKATKYMDMSRLILEKIIKEKKEELANNHDYIENSNEVPLLDLILSYNHTLRTDEQIYQEITLFASAAVESSSYALYLGFTVLGIYSDIQENLYQEVITKIGDNQITSKNIGDLKYTEATINEIMRIVPILPFLSRVTGEDVKLPDGRVLPKGVDFVANIYHLHRDSKYWKDPETFDPTRFLPENAHNIVPYSFMPFSVGPRDCIGKHYGMTVLKVTYANVIRRFKIITKHKSIDEFKLCSAVTVYPTVPLDLRFIPRKLL